MYLAQTNLEVDTTKVYSYGTPIFKSDRIEVYLTVPVKGSATQMVRKKDFEQQGRNAEIFEVTTMRERKLFEIK